MNVKKITFLLLSVCSVMNMSVNAEEFSYDELYAGSFGVVGELPDFARWHYFAFDESEGVVLKGTSDFELENLNPGSKIGTEKINTDWQARTDWDFAFHAYDVRTNSGAAGNGNAGAIFIADAASAGETSLDAVYTALTEAPERTYNADAVASGNFYFSLETMPPPRATSLSVCAATRKVADGATSASADFYSFAMGAAASENPMIIILKTTSGKYVKIHLTQFTNAEGKPGFLKFNYDFIPLAGASGISTADASSLTIHTRPDLETLNVRLSEPAEIAVYNLAGLPVKQLKAQPGEVVIPVSAWEKGAYIVKINTQKENRTQKIIIR